MTRTVLELTGQSGFGYSFDSLTERSEEHPFARILKDLTYDNYLSVNFIDLILEMEIGPSHRMHLL